MSETSFPVKDLLRRKFQTSLIVITLTLCVASTLFLLLSADGIGVGISLTIEGRVTPAFSLIFSRFVLFIGVLSFIIGGVIASFMAFVMMSQRVKDIGLMKAAGCPNDLIFAHFATELIIITLLSCLLGAIFGTVANLAFGSLFNGFGFQLFQQSINLWLVFLVFVVFLILTSILGVKPILDATKLEPAKAVSPTHYLGLNNASGFKVISKSGFTLKIALRNLCRHRSATLRITLCLIAVFILVTATVGGGIIADQTSKNWIEKAIGRDEVLIAHQEMGSQYKLLLSKFYDVKESPAFNYTDESYLISDEFVSQLGSIQGMKIDPRLITETHVQEVPGYAIDPITGDSVPVGGNREGVSIIIGVEPEKALNQWYANGKSLGVGQEWKAMIGDSVSQIMFDQPLDQSVTLFNARFGIVGVCIDPINDGNVTYVPLKNLQSVMNVSKPNIILAKIDSSNRAETLNQIKTLVSAVNPEFEVFDLNEILDRSLDFLGYIWSTIMFLPLFSLGAASLCLVSYVMLVVNEQRQEFGIIRAIGVKPRDVIKIISGQGFIVLFSCYATGIALGLIVTLLILVPEPLVTGFTIAEISAWLLIALAATFAFNLYLAIKFAKKPVLDIMNP